MVLFKNEYHLRKVAESSSKPCAFCYKPTTSVLITADGTSDFFYTCDSHLKDPTFASPIYEEEYLEAKRTKEKLDLEIKQLKLKWDEKNRYAGWDKFVSYTKSFRGGDKKLDDKKLEEASKNKPDLNNDDKLKELSKQSTSYEAILLKQPRRYELNNDIFKIRLDKKKKPKSTSAQNPSITKSTITPKDLANLPSVPTNDLS